jgi:DNA replicative helicase MCM subunit Mcm2 (Cdc46/Mcm family)
MSKTVTPDDIDVAVNLIHLSIFGVEMDEPNESE